MKEETTTAMQVKRLVGMLSIFVVLAYTFWCVLDYISAPLPEQTLLGRVIQNMPDWVRHVTPRDQEILHQNEYERAAPDKKLRETIETLGLKPLSVGDIGLFLYRNVTANKNPFPSNKTPIVDNSNDLYSLADQMVREGRDRVIFQSSCPDLRNLCSPIAESLNYYLSDVNLEDLDNGKHCLTFFYTDFYRILRTVNDGDWTRLSKDEIEALHKLLDWLAELKTPQFKFQQLPKEKKAYDIAAILCKHVEYDRGTQKSSSKEKADAIREDSVFYKNRSKFVLYATRGKAICEGYAQTYGLLLAMVGVRSLPVAGVCSRKEELPGWHAWNLVNVEANKWYHYDTTWADGDKGLAEFWLQVKGQKIKQEGRASSDMVFTEEEKQGEIERRNVERVMERQLPLPKTEN